MRLPPQANRSVKQQLGGDHLTYAKVVVHIDVIKKAHTYNRGVRSIKQDVFPALMVYRIQFRAGFVLVSQQSKTQTGGWRFWSA